MKRPKIGVISLYDKEKDSLWMLPGYTSGIEAAGGLPVVLPLTENAGVLDQYCEELDGFLFTGGQDVNPAFYRAQPEAACGEICSMRDEMERYLILRLLSVDKPMLGICRGLQMMNVVLGGTLYQDIPTQIKTDVCHYQSRPYDAMCHQVDIMPGSWLFDCLQQDSIEVNSIHHQGIQTPSPYLSVSATAPDGLVEAVEVKGASFAVAVQWHPEYLYNTDSNSRILFENFVERASNFV